MMKKKQNKNDNIKKRTTPLLLLKLLLFSLIPPKSLSYFPSNSMAFDPEGHKIYLKDLNPGEKVLSMHLNGTIFPEEVLSFSRKKESKEENAMMRIAYIDPTDKKTVRGVHLSPNHLILTGKHGIESKFAKDVKKGDKIIIFLKGYVTVISVDIKRKSGIFSPITKSGRILIDGVLVSCYEDFPSHLVGHTLYGYYLRFSGKMPDWVKTSIFERRWGVRSFVDYALEGLYSLARKLRSGGGDGDL